MSTLRQLFPRPSTMEMSCNNSITSKILDTGSSNAKTNSVCLSNLIHSAGPNKSMSNVDNSNKSDTKNAFTIVRHFNWHSIPPEATDKNPEKLSPYQIVVGWFCTRKIFNAYRGDSSDRPKNTKAMVINGVLDILESMDIKLPHPDPVKAIRSRIDNMMSQYRGAKYWLETDGQELLDSIKNEKDKELASRMQLDLDRTLCNICKEYFQIDKLHSSATLSPSRSSHSHSNANIPRPLTLPLESANEDTSKHVPTIDSEAPNNKRGHRSIIDDFTAAAAVKESFDKSKRKLVEDQLQFKKMKYQDKKEHIKAKVELRHLEIEEKRITIQNKKADFKISLLKMLFDAGTLEKDDFVKQVLFISDKLYK